MYAMNQAALGHLSGAPFRDPVFAVYNRANGSGEQWPLHRGLDLQRAGRAAETRS